MGQQGAEAQGEVMARCYEANIKDVNSSLHIKCFEVTRMIVFGFSTKWPAQIDIVSMTTSVISISQEKLRL